MVKNGGNQKSQPSKKKPDGRNETQTVADHLAGRGSAEAFKMENSARYSKNHSAAHGKNSVQSISDPACSFDRVWVITLKRRADRLARFWNNMEKIHWPFRRPQVFHAIDGDKVGVPKFWQTGGGSYGCLRSHLVLLERAIQDDIGSILILEDDASFMKTFSEDVSDFLADVPSDWQCLMLGGQHVNSEPIPIAPGIVRAGGGGGIQRTHCYALRGQEVMKALYQTWANAAVHCDWVMGPCMAKFNTYAPDPFLVGQSDGYSDISGRQNPAKFWRSPSGNEPVIVLHAPREVMENLRDKGWHAGYTRDPLTGVDVGLRDLFSNGTLSQSQRLARLKDWITMIQWEVVSMSDPALCVIWHPEARADFIRPLLRGRVVEITASSAEEALSQLPNDIYKLTSEEIRVVLLRASRETMESLREQGWHTGYWRDEVTGQDNGVRRLFALTKDKARRSLGLQNIIRVLYEEVQGISGGVVTIWHEDITPDMLETEGIKVFDIAADNPKTAMARLKELTDEA